METNHVKQENRRALPRFLLTILGASILGGVGGGLVSADRTGVLAGSVGTAVNRILTATTPWGILVSGVILLGIAWGFYRSGKRLYSQWDGENDAPVDMAAEKLSYTLLFSTLEMVICFFFLSASFPYAYSQGPYGILLVVVEFIAVVVGIVVLQQRVVDLEKSMNPEKRGSVYDSKFHRKWMDSCDEAQRSQVFQASYHAHMITSRACVFVWLMLIFLNFMFHFGLMPSFVVLLIWGISQVSYALACIRMGRHKIG